MPLIPERIRHIGRCAARLCEPVTGYAERRRAAAVSRQSKPYRAYDARDVEQYFEQVATNYAGFCNGFAYYVELVEALRSMRELRVVPAVELATQSTDASPRVTLRHDVDADPVTGLRLARHLARMGICGTFYLLHSAPYYGDVHGGIVVRQPQLAGWLRGYIVAGCEIGLHNDALGMYCAHDIDPLALLKTELAWLRAQGACVRGTSAHNSISATGAENYEVFTECVLWRRNLDSFSGRRLALGAAPMSDLGLTYEGTFALPRDTVEPARAEVFASKETGADIRSETWMREYLIDNPVCRWTVDFQLWLLGRDRWVIAGARGSEPVFEWDVRLADVKRFVSDLPPHSTTLFVLHPEYFGDYD